MLFLHFVIHLTTLFRTKLLYCNLTLISYFTDIFYRFKVVFLLTDKSINLLQILSKVFEKLLLKLSIVNDAAVLH